MPTLTSITVETALESALFRLTPMPVGPTTTLAGLGLDSLGLIRIVLTVLGEDNDFEIDPAGLAALRTVADLRDWLAATVNAATASGTVAP